MGEFSQVTQTGWGKNIKNAFGGLIFGIILFFGSFVVLWMNEGGIDKSKVAATSVEIPGDKVDASKDKAFVSVSGKFFSPEKLGDPGYVLPGDYVTLNRNAEMYAWVEEKHTESRDKVGGGTETITTYSYSTRWTSSPSSTSTFNSEFRSKWESKYNVRIYNPPMTVSSRDYKVGSAKIGAWGVDMTSISLPGGSKLALNDGNVVAGNVIDGDYIYQGNGSLITPKVGDIRISYTALENNFDGTAFGEARSSGMLAAYQHSGEKKAAADKLRRDTTIYRVFKGSREDAIKQLATEHKLKLWGLRILGFVLMWVGLQMIFGPLVAIAKVLPFLANLGKGMIGLITFLVSLVLSIVTIIIAAVAHSVVALIVVLVIVVAVVVIIIATRKKSTPAATQ